jgi:hypothetical protein
MADRDLYAGAHQPAGTVGAPPAGR